MTICNGSPMTVKGERGREVIHQVKLGVGSVKRRPVMFHFNDVKISQSTQKGVEGGSGYTRGQSHYQSAYAAYGCLFETGYASNLISL